jgi:hypothetical protein
MSCQASCTTDCIASGAAFLNLLTNNFILDASPTVGPFLVNVLSQARETIRCTLPPNIRKRLDLLISQLTSTSATAAEEALGFTLLVIFLTILLLTIFTYIAIYVLTPTAIGICFFLSFVIIVIAVIILYFGAKSIYNSSFTQIDSILKEIQSILTGIICAAENGLCCVGTKNPFVPIVCDQFSCVTCPAPITI